MRGGLFTGSGVLRDELGALAAVRGTSALLRCRRAALRSEPAAPLGSSALRGVLAALRGVLLPPVLCEALECLERLDRPDVEECLESGDLDVRLDSQLLSDFFGERPRGLA
jgi:hypothetical protein